MYPLCTGRDSTLSSRAGVLRRAYASLTAPEDRIDVCSGELVYVESCQNELHHEEANAEAHNQDPEWYEFIRTMELLPDAFSNKSDVMLIDSDQEILKYFKDSSGEEK